jgi:hypothetical protein
MGPLGVWRKLACVLLLVSGIAQAQEKSNVHSGVLTVVWGDPAPGSNQPARLLGLVTGAEGKTVRIELTPELLAAVGGLDQIDHRQVEVTLRGSDSGLWAIRQAEAIHPAGRADEALVSGSQPWISILCKFSDVADQPKDLSYFLGMYGNAMGGLDHYWRQVSYDQVDIVGSTAVDWLTLPHPRSHYIQPDGYPDFGALAQDCTAAADPLIDFSAGGYVGINLMFNAVLDCCAWGGGWYGTLDGVTKVWRTTWEPPWGYGNEGVIAHEMGHGFGLPHSNNSDGDGDPYDNPWDVMSGLWGFALYDPVYGVLGKHTISYHKDLLGWIAPDEKFEVLHNGSHSFILDHLAAATASNDRMAQIRMPGPVSYTVESRKQNGYDGALAAEAVLIHEVVLYRGEPAWLVDANSPPASYSDNEGVMWRPGETFVDPTGQLQVTVDEATAAGFKVTIVADRRGPIYQEDFQAGSGGFWPTGLWHQTAACAAGQAGHSGPTAFYFGIDSRCDYADGSAPSGNLTSPAISLAGLAPPLTLTFHYFLETEPGAFDLAEVHVSQDGGPSRLVASNVPGPDRATLQDPSGGWRTASIDLTPFAGRIWLDFSFHGDAVSNDFAGFYVDDIAVWSCFSAPVLDLADQVVTTEQTFRACETLTAGQDFEVAPQGSVTFRAGKNIVLKSGFSVTAGGTFTAAIGPPEP